MKIDGKVSFRLWISLIFFIFLIVFSLHASFTGNLSVCIWGIAFTLPAASGGILSVKSAFLWMLPGSTRDVCFFWFPFAFCSIICSRLKTLD